jgi:hypothetical protein
LFHGCRDTEGIDLWENEIAAVGHPFEIFTGLDLVFHVLDLADLSQLLGIRFDARFGFA